MNQLMRFFPNTENTVSKKMYKDHVVYNDIEDYYGFYTFFYPNDNKLFFRGKEYKISNNTSEKDIDFLIKCYVNYFTDENKLIQSINLSTKEMKVNFDGFYIKFDLSGRIYTTPMSYINGRIFLLNESSCINVFGILKKHGIKL